ncbi:hypothetical protein [Dysgonomonas sp. 520]|uniref:gliding motility lipoprotein GldB n=1 Tax=Dysgonomonas sp. 520 TaxID=2302931 RepID=UPI0013D27B4A|nr:hypothetical protein [Dysgonomonas sp. 520]NDW11091.1 hypothetical protein [Dysgonomonas sp. 520]
MKSIHSYIIYSLLIIYGFISCSQKSKNDSIETVNSEGTVKIERFDKALFNYLETPTANGESELKTDFKNFLPAFGYITIGEANADSSIFFPKLKQYYANDMLLHIYKDALSRFEDISKYETELSNANELIKKNFDGKQLPMLGIHISGFKSNTIAVEDYISISSDKYLGQDYPAYSQFFEDFQRIQMRPEMITRDILRAWIISEMKPDSKKKDLLEFSVNEGKILYTLSFLLPEWEKTDLLGYTEDQWKWCDDNEKNIWKVIIKNNYLFSTENLLISKFMAEAPHTAPISPESPGRIGAWLGFKIVDLYVKKSNVSIKDLLATDATSILKSSKYNPQ